MRRKILICRRDRRGTIFIVTLWIIFVLAGMVLALGGAMRVEAIASANHVASLQAMAIERGAEQYVLALLDQQKDSLTTLTDDYFAQVPVGDGFFWLIRPNYGDNQFSSLGLLDEASKLNINTATKDMLLPLPGMTDDLAAAIVDWRDADSDISPNGAESEYYLSLPNPYNCKNAPFETVEELLLVRGMTPELLYGQNFQAGGGGGGAPGMNVAAAGGQLMLGADQQLARGLYDLLTVYSSEPATATTAGGGGPQQPGRTPAGGGNTAQQGPAQGHINVNTASREVLASLPGLDDNDVTKLMSARLGNTSDPTSTAWIDQALPGNKLAAIRNLITGQAYQYSADIVAISGNGRAFKRFRVVIDLQQSPPAIVYRRDLTDQGFPLDREILMQLRRGTAAQGAGRSKPAGAF
jgi:type II secretory pathway component PulK